LGSQAERVACRGLHKPPNTFSRSMDSLGAATLSEVTLLLVCRYTGR
jgi:hypothetical protein